MRVGVDAGVVDGNDVLGGLEGLGDGCSVLGGFAGTEVQGLQTAVSEPAVEGRGNGTNGVLQESETFLQGLGVEGSNAHENILGGKY